MPFRLSRTDLKELRRVAEALDYQVDPPYPKRFAGWVRICDRTVVYKKGNVIIKAPNFILNQNTPLQVRVPTIKLDYQWVAQPVVKKVNTKLAMELISKQLRKNHGCDLHRWNVGWYDGEPVMFDW